MKRIFLHMMLALVAAGCMACDGVVQEQASYRTGEHMPKSAKRGVCFSFKYAEDLPLLSPYISWSYNWANTATDLAATWFDANEMDYCPMCWNGHYSADAIRAYVAAHPKTQYLLAFNEPNLTDQAHMTPAEAAALWPELVALAKELNLKLVSPAMNYGTLEGYGDPIKWLDEFFALVGGTEDIAAISVHAYMASPSAVKGYIERFRKYDKPVWLTEFCAWEPAVSSVESQMNYMCQMLNYLEKEPLVARYAWFIPRANTATDAYPYQQLLTKESPYALTDLGKIYCLFSSFDADYCHDLNQYPRVPAHQYIALSSDALTLRPTADGKALYFNNLTAGAWIDYQVLNAQGKNRLSLHYASFSDSEICIYDGERALGFLTCPKTGSLTDYATALFALPEDLGSYHHLRIELLSGAMHFDYFEIN